MRRIFGRLQLAGGGLELRVRFRSDGGHRRNAYDDDEREHDSVFDRRRSVLGDQKLFDIVRQAFH